MLLKVTCAQNRKKINKQITYTPRFGLFVFRRRYLFLRRKYSVLGLGCLGVERHACRPHWTWRVASAQVFHRTFLHSFPKTSAIRTGRRRPAVDGWRFRVQFPELRRARPAPKAQGLAVHLQRVPARSKIGELRTWPGIAEVLGRFRGDVIFRGMAFRRLVIDRQVQQAGRGIGFGGSRLREREILERFAAWRPFGRHDVFATSFQHQKFDGGARPPQETDRLRFGQRVTVYSVYLQDTIAHVQIVARQRAVLYLNGKQSYATCVCRYKYKLETVKTGRSIQEETGTFLSVIFLNFVFKTRMKISIISYCSLLCWVCWGLFIYDLCACFYTRFCNFGWK